MNVKADCGPLETTAPTKLGFAVVEDGLISFRVRSGKGAKPARIPVDSFAEVVELLAGTLAAVEKAGNRIK